MVWMRNDPFLSNAWGDLDRTFAQLLRGWPGTPLAGAPNGAPRAAMNVGETAEAAVVELEVPGVPRDALEVTVGGQGFGQLKVVHNNE